MLDNSVVREIVQNPSLNEYLLDFHAGEFLCTEGDESKDLHILLSGRLALYKGDKKITEISEEGTPVGEISFLLQSRRTATVKALSPVKTVCIPQEKLETFLAEFPALMWRISEVLARRLDAGTQVWQALKEFCDNVPDAVVAAEKGGRIITWNRSAETLFGRSWDQMQGASADELYRDSDQYRRALAGLEQSDGIKEKVFAVDHPQRGQRFISTSLNFLYDGKRNISGVLALSRDVTESERMRRNYRRILFWMLPLLLAVGVAVGASFFAVPYFKGRSRIHDIQHQALRDRIANDYLLLHSLVSAALEQGDTAAIRRVLRDFARMRQESFAPYRGLVLLGRDKKVVTAYSLQDHRIKTDMVGSSYADIPFEAIEGSCHSVLSVYWADDATAFGQKGVELAFEVKPGDQPAGWLILQMDTRRLAREYAADESVLKTYKF
jgi:PAS domain S-box-containing protein